MIPLPLRTVPLLGWPLLALLAQLCMASTAAWAESADEWLLRMGQAFREQNYDGTFIYMRGDELQSFRIIHRADAGIEQERLIHLDGATRELLRSSAGLFVIQADPSTSETAAASASFAQSFVREPGQLAQHYRLELLGDERVSNRQSRHIAIRPHDPDRYSYDLWIDQASGLLLRSLLRDTNGRTLERFQFVTLRVADDVNVGDLTSMTSGSTTLHRVQPKTAPNSWKVSREWRVGWAPKGFVSQQHPTDNQTETQPSLLHSELFSDGLYAFSVFVETLDPNETAQDGRRQRGATSAVTNRIPYRGEHVMVTVVGEIPLETAARIAHSVAPAP